MSACVASFDGGRGGRGGGDRGGFRGRGGGGDRRGGGGGSKCHYRSHDALMTSSH